MHLVEAAADHGQGPQHSPEQLSPLLVEEADLLAQAAGVHRGLPLSDMPIYLLQSDVKRNRLMRQNKSWRRYRPTVNVLIWSWLIR